MQRNLTTVWRRLLSLSLRQGGPLRRVLCNSISGNTRQKPHLRRSQSTSWLRRAPLNDVPRCGGFGDGKITRESCSTRGDTGCALVLRLTRWGARPCRDLAAMRAPTPLLMTRRGATMVDAHRERYLKAEARRRAERERRDADGLLLHFTQGTTDYSWRVVSSASGAVAVVKMPCVERADTVQNNVRLFGMPKGYPDTTADGYRRFFYLSQVSAFVSNFSSSIGYQSLLNGFFLGGSAQMWMLKDLAPALLAAYMANRVVSYENRPKFWFCVSVFMNNATVMTDMVIPTVVPNHLLLAAIMTSTIKQSSALMYFVSRASALQHFSINNNLAEITKKFNSFGMVNYTVASAMGIVFCTYIASFPVQVVTALTCCALNMILAPMSMYPIAFRILNFTTVSLILRAYINDGRVLTPAVVSKMLGTRMKLHFDKNPHDMERLLYVSPPINKLAIYSDRLEQDVLYVCRRGMFMLALWQPTAVPLTLRECWDRYRLPSVSQYARRCFACLRRCFYGLNPTARSRRRLRKLSQAEQRFHGKRLVLLVHRSCAPADLLTAYLIMYNAIMRHAASEETLRMFIRGCNADQAQWERRARTLRARLRDAEWDVELPAMDHPNGRLSSLIVPPSMQPDNVIQSAEAGAPQDEQPMPVI